MFILMLTYMAHRLVQLDTYPTISAKFVNALIALPPEEWEIWKTQSRLGATLALAQINLDWLLIEAAISFWDPTCMVFRFGKHELTPTLEELESFLGWDHCLGTRAIIPNHKPSYWKNFHALDISKASLPKEATGEYLHCPFDLLLEKGWKKPGNFDNLVKFKAFTLVILGQLLLSHSHHHIHGILLNILDQHL